MFPVLHGRWCGPAGGPSWRRDSATCAKATRSASRSPGGRRRVSWRRAETDRRRRRPDRGLERRLQLKTAPLARAVDICSLPRASEPRARPARSRPMRAARTAERGEPSGQARCPTWPDPSRPSTLRTAASGRPARRAARPARTRRRAPAASPPLAALAPAAGISSIGPARQRHPRRAGSGGRSPDSCFHDA